MLSTLFPLRNDPTTINQRRQAAILLADPNLDQRVRHNILVMVTSLSEYPFRNLFVFLFSILFTISVDAHFKKWSMPLHNDVLKPEVETHVNLEMKYCQGFSLSDWSLEDETIRERFGKLKEPYCTSPSNLFYLLKQGCYFQYYEPEPIELVMIMNMERQNRPGVYLKVTENYSVHKNTHAMVTGISTELIIDTSITSETQIDKNSIGDSKEIIKDKLEEEAKSISDNSEKQSSVKSHITWAYMILFTLLVLSVLYNLTECFFEKRRRRLEKDASKDEEDINVAVPGQSNAVRKMSIADLTINRHARRESIQNESSISANSSVSDMKRMSRRKSFPAQVPEFLKYRAKSAPTRQHTWSAAGVNGRRTSIDLNDDDSSLDRRRVRIIRRH